jgi:predicted amidophosphoribosyltransferase
MALQTQSLICDSGDFKHHYLCHYRSKSSGSDELSKSILQFKNGNEIHVNVWIDCAVGEFEKVSLKEDVVIVRALGHQEEKAGTTSLDLLGKKLADSFHAQYIPSLLTKSSTPKLAMLKRHERADAIFDQYSFSGIDLRDILIIDDILTTGATMCAIAKSIRTISPSCAITIFTLAATGNNPFLGDSLKRSGYFNPLQTQQRGMVQEEGNPYSEAMTLRSKILNDSFH